MKIFIEGNIHDKGVYQIVVDKIHYYIGQTNRNFRIRWSEHLTSFKNNTCNRYFRACLKPDSKIEFSVLRVCRTKEECINWEKKLIKEYNPDLNVIKYK